MQPVQIIFDFFKEMINRLSTKSPFFFKILMVIAASLTFAGYIPSMLQVWFNVDVSGNVISFCEGLAKYMTGFLVASGMTAKSSIVGQTGQGNEVKVTSEKKMPFTAKAEQKEILKTIPPPDILEQVPEKSVQEIKIDTSNFPSTATIPDTPKKDT